jgi:hypothetical protein
LWGRLLGPLIQGKRLESTPRLRRRLTLLEVVCRKCGDPLITVLATRPDLTLRYWPVQAFMRPMPIGLSAYEESIRRGPVKYQALMTQRSLRLNVACSCRRVSWTMGDVLDALAANRRKVTIP